MTDEILAMLDADEYPALYGYLAAQLDDAGGAEPDGPYDMALRLLALDRPKPLPPYVIELIEALLLRAVDAGDADAMNTLGAQYYDGSRGFEQSYRKAAYYYTLAVEHGSRQARENLGYVYYYGRLGAPDYERAFHLFAPGAFEGRPVSLYKIGDMYRNGYYVPKNEQEAFCIYMRCLETMTPETEPFAAGPVYLRLGRMFLDGTGADRDAKTALLCFQKAEIHLYDMVLGGHAMYKKSLRAAVEGQSKARAELLHSLDDALS